MGEDVERTCVGGPWDGLRRLGQADSRRILGSYVGLGTFYVYDVVGDLLIYRGDASEEFLADELYPLPGRD